VRRRLKPSDPSAGYGLVKEIQWKQKPGQSSMRQGCSQARRGARQHDRRRFQYPGAFIATTLTMPTPAATSARPAGQFEFAAVFVPLTVFSNSSGVMRGFYEAEPKHSVNPSKTFLACRIERSAGRR